MQIPSQMRFLRYYEVMRRDYGGNPPPGPPIRITSITLSSTPRFDPDGGCDPFVVIWRRRPVWRGYNFSPSRRGRHPPQPGASERAT